MTIHVHGFVWMYAFILLGRFLGVELLDLMASLCLTLQKTTKVFLESLFHFTLNSGPVTLKFLFFFFF